MGYLPEMFAFLSKHQVPAGARLLDLGSQDIYTNGQPDDFAILNRFIAQYGGEPLPADTPRVFPAAEVWRRAGIDYSCIDVDERPGTIRVDLQALDFPKELRGQFDMVANHGTTEHLSNPIGGLTFMHYVCKPGGLMLHDVPLYGMGNHGLMNPTPKFWHQLVLMNAYDIVHAGATHWEDTAMDEANFFHSYLDYIENLSKARGASWMIRLLYRKTEERPFIPPLDAVMPESKGEKEAAMVAGSMLPALACGLYTVEEVTQAINLGMAALGKTYRTDHLPEEISARLRARSLTAKLRRLTRRFVSF